MDKRFFQNSAVIVATLTAAIAVIRLQSNWLSPNPVGHLDRERCYGISKAGKNDCATSHHSCAAQSGFDRDNNEWLWVPVGTCLRITGGAVK